MVSALDGSEDLLPAVALPFEADEIEAAVGMREALARGGEDRESRGYRKWLRGKREERKRMERERGREERERLREAEKYNDKLLDLNKPLLELFFTSMRPDYRVEGVGNPNNNPQRM